MLRLLDVLSCRVVSFASGPKISHLVVRTSLGTLPIYSYEMGLCVFGRVERVICRRIAILSTLILGSAWCFFRETIRFATYSVLLDGFQSRRFRDEGIERMLSKDRLIFWPLRAPFCSTEF